MQKLYLVCFILFFSFSVVFGQNKQPYFWYGGNIFKGFIVKHTSHIGHLAQSHPQGIELFLNKNTTGQNLWEYYYNYPDVGFSLSYINSNNNTIGNIYTALAYLDFYPHRWKRGDLIFKIGAGTAYCTNPYNRELNNLNNVIGNDFSYALQLRVGYLHKISSSWKFSSALTITHISNGAYQLPNMGVNIPTLNIGMAYSPNAFERQFIKPDYITEKKEKLKLNLTIASGLKEVLPISGKKYPFLHSSAYLDKRLGYRSAVSIGGDFFYSWALKSEIENSFSIPANDRPDFKRAAVTLGHELFVGKVSLLTQLGVYVYSPYRSAPVYQRYGLKYYLKEKYYLSLALKSHFAVAEAVEWGIGVRI